MVKSHQYPAGLLFALLACVGIALFLLLILVLRENAGRKPYDIAKYKELIEQIVDERVSHITANEVNVPTEDAVKTDPIASEVKVLTEEGMNIIASGVDDRTIEGEKFLNYVKDSFLQIKKKYFTRALEEVSNTDLTQTENPLQNMMDDLSELDETVDFMKGNIEYFTKHPTNNEQLIKSMFGENANAQMVDSSRAAITIEEYKIKIQGLKMNLQEIAKSVQVEIKEPITPYLQNNVSLGSMTALRVKLQEDLGIIQETYSSEYTIKELISTCDDLLSQIENIEQSLKTAVL